MIGCVFQSGKITLINTSISENLITAEFTGSGNIFIKPTDILEGGKIDARSTGCFN